MMRYLLLWFVWASCGFVGGSFAYIRGTAGRDYPILHRVPDTGFRCRANGYFADVQAGCQAYHVCQGRRKTSFLCPNGTLFHQKYLVCDWWFNVNCKVQSMLAEKIPISLLNPNEIAEPSRVTFSSPLTAPYIPSKIPVSTAAQTILTNIPSSTPSQSNDIAQSTDHNHSKIPATITAQPILADSRSWQSTPSNSNEIGQPVDPDPSKIPATISAAAQLILPEIPPSISYLSNISQPADPDPSEIPTIIPAQVILSDIPAPLTHILIPTTQQLRPTPPVPTSTIPILANPGAFPQANRESIIFKSFTPGQTPILDTVSASATTLTTPLNLDHAESSQQLFEQRLHVYFPSFYAPGPTAIEAIANGILSL